MTLMRLKLDENLDVGLAVWLESLGHDAKTVRDEQMSGASDNQVLPQPRLKIVAS